MGTHSNLNKKVAQQRLASDLSTRYPTMSDTTFDPTGVETVGSGVNAAKEDAGVSEDRITDQDRDGITNENVVSGGRSNKGGVQNYAEADDKADAGVEDTAGISVQ